MISATGLEFRCLTLVHSDTSPTSEMPPDLTLPHFRETSSDLTEISLDFRDLPYIHTQRHVACSSFLYLLLQDPHVSGGLSHPATYPGHPE